MSKIEILEAIKIRDNPETHPGYSIIDYKVNGVRSDGREQVGENISEFRISQYSHSTPVTLKEGEACDAVVGNYYGNGVLLKLDNHGDFREYRYVDGVGENNIQHRPGDTYVYFAFRIGLQYFSAVSPSLAELKEEPAEIASVGEINKRYADGERNGYVLFCKAYHDYLNYNAKEERKFIQSLGHGR